MPLSQSQPFKLALLSSLGISSFPGKVHDLLLCLAPVAPYREAAYLGARRHADRAGPRGDGGLQQSLPEWRQHDTGRAIVHILNRPAAADHKIQPHLG